MKTVPTWTQHWSLHGLKIDECPYRGSTVKHIPIGSQMHALSLDGLNHEDYPNKDSTMKIVPTGTQQQKIVLKRTGDEDHLQRGEGCP